MKDDDSNNPYRAPSSIASDLPSNVDTSVVASQIRGPAIGLIAVSVACLCFLVLSGGITIWYLMSGNLRKPAARTDLLLHLIRLGIYGLIFVLNGFVLYGGIKMMQMRSYGFAKLGAVLAIIPCLGPCYFLGIPFGIWAWLALSKPGVKDAFRS